MNELLVGTTKGLFTIDGPSAFEGRTVTALARDGARVWALIEAQEVWMRDDGWRLVATVETEGACLLATPDAILVGTEEAHLYRIRDGGAAMLEEFEDAPGRSEWYTPWGGPPAVRSLASSDGRFFVNVHVGGILRSDDLRSFEPKIDIHTDVHQVIAAGARAAAALGDEGVALSTDAATTWEIVTEGLHGGYVRAVAFCGDTVLATASSGPFAHDGAVYRLREQRFEPCADELPAKVDGNIDSGWLVADGPHAAVATPDGDVYRSDDGGIGWRRVAGGLPEPRWLLLA